LFHSESTLYEKGKIATRRAQISETRQNMARTTAQGQDSAACGLSLVPTRPSYPLMPSRKSIYYHFPSILCRP